jgi:hypothetical protein
LGAPQWRRRQPLWFAKFWKHILCLLVSLAFTFHCMFYVLRVLELYTQGFLFTSILSCNLFCAAILVARIVCARLW